MAESRNPKYNHFDVFNFLCELVTDEEFQVAQGQFFQQNCKEFDEEEENKFIYTNIYEEYVKILDQVIDQKLLSKFPDLDLPQFLEDFKQNYKKYENQNVVDVLFSFTDFLKFKENMISYKKGLINTTLSKEGSNSSSLISKGQQDEDFKLFYKLLNDSLKLWRKTMEGKKELPMTIYQRQVEGIPIDVCRVEVLLLGVNFNTVLELFDSEDNDYIKKQARFIKDFRIVEKINENTKIQYIRSNMPIMTDREFLVKTTLNRNENGGILLQSSVEREDVPIQKDVIRAEIFKGIVLEQIGKDCKMIEISYVNIKGYIPKMLLNMFVSKTVSEEIKKLHKYCLDQQKKLNNSSQSQQQNKK